MKLNRVSAALMVMTMAAGCLSACGSSAEGNNKTSKSDNAEDPSKETVTIKYVTWESSEKNNPLIAQFEEENPNIKVDITVVPDSNNTAESLDIIAMGGGEMDVWPFQSGGQFTRMQQGLLLDISDYIERDGIDMEDWFGSYMEWGQYNGTYYGLPSTASVGMVFYNKDMFDAAGLDYPSEDWTIDEYSELAEKLTKSDGGNTVYGTFQNTFPEDWGIYGAQTTSLYGEDGLSSFSMDNKDFIKSLELRKKLDDEGCEISYAQNVANFSYSSAEFLGGKCAMTPGYSWVLRDMKDKENFPFDFNVGICYFPRISEDAPKKPSQVSVNMLGIPSSAAHPDEAWEFIKFMTQNGTAQTVSDGNIPTYQGVDMEGLVDKLIEGTPLTKEQGEMFFADDMHMFTAVPTGIAAGEYSTIINEETGLYFSGEQTIEDTVGNIKIRADEAIQKTLSESDK